MDTSIRFRRPRSIHRWIVSAALLGLMSLASPCLAGSHHSHSSSGSTGSDAAVPSGGQWMIDPKQDDGTVRLVLRVRGNKPRFESWDSYDLPLARLEGLTRERLEGAPTRVSFRLRRDAGTFECEGQVSAGKGGGVFDLTLDPAFAQGLRRRGLAAPTAREQYELARAGPAGVREALARRGDRGSRPRGRRWLHSRDGGRRLR